MNPRKSNWKIFVCFACIYFIWGSTYLAIKYVVSEVSPLLMTAVRFLTAAIILELVGRARKEVGLNARDRTIALVSGLLLATANALICVSEQWISSGTAAVLCGASPVCIVLFNWFFFDHKRPQPRQVFGILLSFVGVWLLGQATSSASSVSSTHGVIAVVSAVLLWAIGSLVQRRAGDLRNVIRFTAVQLFFGSCGVGLLGLVFEDPTRIHLERLHLVAVLCFLHLVIFGSAVAFSSYLYLHRHVDPAKVSTYAVVNPVIAVWLGWLIGGEVVNVRTIIYSALVLFGLYFAVIAKRQPRPSSH